MELFTPRLFLREFTQADFTALREMDSQEIMHTYERTPPTEAETRRTLEESLKNQTDIPRTVYRLAITIPPLDEVRGLIKLSRQWESIREWEIGWAVHPLEWGNGYATEAAWYVMDFAFRELDVHRMVAFCHVDNRASIRVMEKLGMHLDGRLRETRWLNGTWWDEYVYTLLDREWAKHKAGSVH